MSKNKLAMLKMYRNGLKNLKSNLTIKEQKLKLLYEIKAKLMNHNISYEEYHWWEIKLYQAHKAPYTMSY